MKKVYVVGYGRDYARFLQDYKLVDSVEEADIVIFTGGEDVDPSLYGMKKHPTTWSNIDRDLAEKQVFDHIPSDKLVLGICRGSQLLSVLNGGLLVQDCDNHALGSTHEIVNKDGEKYEITSTHHQMQFPFYMPKEDYDILYWASPARSRRHAGFVPQGQMHKFWDDKKMVEPEIVLYHKEGNPRCLAVQGHPEMMPSNHATVTMLNELVNSLLEK